MITEGARWISQRNHPHQLWRTHSDTINKALLSRWWPPEGAKYLLKTDLFDEAVNEGLYTFLTDRAEQVMGMDISFPIIKQAKSRFLAYQSVQADVRYLPFKKDSFDLIISYSTLDHFTSIKEMMVSLHELRRVLRPGHQIILTLDNLSNPIILLRNVLPFRWLHHLRIVPYFVGATVGPSTLKYVIQETGFKVIEMETILHCPRVVMVVLSRWLQKHAQSKIQKQFLRLLQRFECLSRLPTCFFTGYFIAIKMAKGQENEDR